jgi:purine-nucleoside/S-methyl-5'-thioadenosine phosphorylase / adenosine deaminase
MITGRRNQRKRSLFPFSVITLPMFDQGVSGLSHAFGTRRASWPQEAADGERLRVVSVNQVHGAEVLVITGWSPQARPDGQEQAADAIVTDQPNTCLTIRTADCVPMLVVDPALRVIAAIHAGWRGTLKEIGPKTLRVMQERFGCVMSSMRVAIGPSIGRCCYEVNNVVMSPMKRAYPYWREVLDEYEGGRGVVDLRRLNRKQMELAGVDPERIETVNLCTACHPELFYSYRRDGKGTPHLTSGIVLA